MNTIQKAYKPFLVTQYNSLLFPYKNHAYHVYKPKQKGLIAKVVLRIIKDYEVMLSHYSKVFIVRVDLHPRMFSANNDISMFLKKTQKLLSQTYSSKVIYHCAREQSSSEVEHYHLAIMLSGHKVKHSSKILSLVERLWHEFSQGVVYWVKNPFCVVIRGNKASLKEAIYRSSYLAKEITKELNGELKSFFSNRVPLPTKIDTNTDSMLVNPDITMTQNQQRINYQQNQSVQRNYIHTPNQDKKYGWK